MLFVLQNYEICIELTRVYKLKLNEYWTNILLTFNEMIAESNINQVKNLFEDDEIVIEMLSVRIDMVSRKPEFKTSKKSIRKFIQKQRQKLSKVNKKTGI